MILINSALRINAAREPSAVLFQIHHVVAAFQIKNAGKLNPTPCQKGWRIDEFTIFSLMKNKGIKAKKIRKVMLIGYQDNQSIIPDKALSIKNINLFFMLEIFKYIYRE